MRVPNLVQGPNDLVTVVATMRVRNAIRHYIRLPKTPFVVAIRLPSSVDTKIYQIAARLLLEEHDVYDENGRYQILIEDMGDMPKAAWDALSKMRAINRAVIFYTDFHEEQEALALAIDEHVDLVPPTARDFEIAARLLKLRIGKEEAVYLAEQSLRDVLLARRPGRSISRVVRQLKSRTQTVEAEPEPPPRKTLVEFRLDELAGYGEAKVWGLRLARDFDAWKRGELDWADMDRGVLLNGPPGSGKTSFGSALANSCDVSLVSSSAAMWQAEGHLGDMLKAMRRSFAQALAVRPCIHFIDEFDSFGDRSVGTDKDHGDYKRQVVNAMLECLDPAGGREGMVVVGATNNAALVDAALLRPGRLERVIDIPRPGPESRVAILRHHLPGADLPELKAFVRASEGWTGAEIEFLAREARRIARGAGRQVAVEDIAAALPPRIEFTAEQRERLAVHEAGHAIVGYSLRPERLVKVSITDSKPMRAGLAQIGTTEFKESSSAMATASYHSDTIAILMAGVAAEKLVFGEHFSAAGGDEKADLSLATDIATMMERSFGFGDSWLADTGSGARPLEYLRLLDNDLRNLVKVRLDGQFQRATEIIRTRQETLQRLTALLVDQLEVSSSEIARLWAGGTAVQ